ncbi:MAG: endonuclease/exonuclease/phosphatase family protein, partial [Candidatus Cryptobacteroides sp.]
TYNLWRSDLGKEDYRWELRKERLVKSILDCNIDIFAAEEVDTTIFREIPEMLENYAWLVFSPYSPGGSGAIKAQAIVYRKDKFKPVNFNHFWLSPTPDEMSSGWDEVKFKRGACCAEFKMLEGGRKFFFMASHFPLGREARLNIASLMIDREKKYNPKSLPSFFTGDLNTREERPESEILRTWWKDSYLELPADRKAGPKGTFNNHGLNEDMDIAPRIDFVYFRGEGIEPLRYVCDDTLYEGLYPSDHCPVYVDFLIH